MIKSLSRNIPEDRESANDRFRVNYGDRNQFKSLEVTIIRSKTGQQLFYQLNASDLPETDSIHFSTSIHNDHMRVHWDRQISDLVREVTLPSEDEIIFKINNALKTLYDNDLFLLSERVNINERTVTHRLGMYLDQLFNDFDVDCEYNRIYDEDICEYFKKEIDLPRIESGIEIGDTEAKTVYPDIVVHKRGTKLNLLVIEVKMAWKNSKGDFDIRKAEAYKNSLGYQYSVYLELGQNAVSKMEWK